MPWSPNLECSMVTDAWYLGKGQELKQRRRATIQNICNVRPFLTFSFSVPKCGSLKQCARQITESSRTLPEINSSLSLNFSYSQGYLLVGVVMGPLGWIPNGRPNFWASTRRSEESWPWRETCATCNGCFHRPCDPLCSPRPDPSCNLSTSTSHMSDITTNWSMKATKSATLTEKANVN